MGLLNKIKSIANKKSDQDLNKNDSKNKQKSKLENSITTLFPLEYLVGDYEFYGKKQLKVLKEFGSKAQPTDYAKQTGIFTVDNHSPYYSGSAYSSHSVSFVTYYGGWHNVDPNRRYYGVRPALLLPSSQSFESLNARQEDGVYKFEDGYYPKDFAQNQGELDEAFSKGKMIKTGRKYSCDITGDIDKREDLNLIQVDEYEFNGKRYIRTMSPGVEDVDIEKILEVKWVEVKPITYIIDPRDRINKMWVAIPEKIPFAGVRFDESRTNYQTSALKIFVDLRYAVERTEEQIAPKEYVLAEGYWRLERNAFKGIKGLDRVVLPPSVHEIAEDCFPTEEFGYIYIDKASQKVVFSKSQPSEEITESIVDTKLMKKVFYDFDGRFNYGIAHIILKDFIERAYKLQHSKTFENALNNGLSIPSLCQKVLDEKMDFKAFKNLQKQFIAGKSDDRDIDVKIYDLMALAYNLGLFEKSSIEVKDSNGKAQNIKVQNIAFNVMQKLLKEIDISDFHMHFQAFDKEEYNEAFLRFLNNKTNLDQLITAEKQTPGFTFDVYQWFKDRTHLEGLGENEYSTSSYPTSEENRFKIKIFETAESGIDKLRWREPTVELLINEFRNNIYNGITHDTQHIANYIGQFASYHKQKYFDKAVEINQERIEAGVPDHLLKKPIKQDKAEAYREYLAKTDSLRQEILSEAGEILNKQVNSANKIFTYEMLAKSDVANLAMGFLTSCCAVLYGAGGGAGRAMIVSPDMQPMVVRDDQDKIIAFGILYVNREEQYAVFNDFEVNVKYRGNDEARKAIYEKALQGTRAFVKEYNNQNPQKPLKIVNAGVSPNWTAINDFIRNNPKSKILKAPNFNDFSYAGSGSWPGDWHKEQYTLWKEGQPLDEGKEA